MIKILHFKFSIILIKCKCLANTKIKKCKINRELQSFANLMDLVSFSSKENYKFKSNLKELVNEFLQNKSIVKDQIKGIKRD